MADEPLSYLNFDLLIEKDKKGYRARVIASPAGETTKYNHFTLPFLEDELRTFTWLPSYIYRHLRLSKPNEDAGTLDQKSFGRRLFKVVFTKGIDKCLVRSLDATKSSAGLRIRLRISADAPELAELPWEYLYIPDLERFPACSKRTPIVRYIELEQPVPSVTMELPLRILVVTAQPSGVGLLNTNQELVRVETALANLQKRELIMLERLEGATVSALRQRLRQSQIHILHFIGHGFFAADTNTGGLILEDEAGQPHFVPAEILGMLLHDHESLRLVFLNACEGARSGSNNTFAGVAQYLVQQGIPAVIAMQFPVSDTAAIALSQAFYQAISDGNGVDTALSEARVVIRAQRNAVGWGTPVLFMRAKDGQLFQVEHAKETSRQTRKPDSATSIFQVPPPDQVPHLIGRQKLVDELTKVLAKASDLHIIGLVGPGGVGKTTLSKQVAHALKDQFPDGVLWANLESSEPDTSKLDTALIAFAQLFDLTEPAGKLIDLSDKASFIKSRLASKKILVVINNAESKEQVEILHLGGSANRTIVTTRNRGMLIDLGLVDGKDIIDAPPLDSKEAIELLEKAVGVERVADDRKGVQRVIEQVGGSPLALRLISGYLNKLKEVNFTRYANLLQQKESLQRRDILRTFQISYEKLDSSCRQLFASLSLFDGPDFGSEAVAALNQLSIESVWDGLAELYSLSLLDDDLGERATSLLPFQIKNIGRYRLHPLLKAFALDRLNDQLENISELRQRIALYYADVAHKYAQPNDHHLLEVEWQNIVISLQWAYENQKWDVLAKGILGLTQNNLGQMGYLDVRGHWSKARELLTWAYEGINHLEDPFVKARILTNMGGFAVRQADFDTALPLLQAAFDLLESFDKSEEVLIQKLFVYDFMYRAILSTDRAAAQQWLERGIEEANHADVDAVRHLQGYLYIQLSSIFGIAGKPNEVIKFVEKGLALLPPDIKPARVSGLNNLAIAYRNLSQNKKAIQVLEQAIPLAREIGDARRLAGLFGSMGLLEIRRGNLNRAIEHLQQAFDLYKHMGDARNVVATYINLGSIYIRLTDNQKALHYLNEALDLARKHRSNRIEAYIRSNLADFYLSNHQPAQAKAELTCVLDKNQKADIDYLLPTLRRQQAEVALVEGQFHQGLSLIEQSLQSVQENQDLEEEGISWRISGCLYSALHMDKQAIASWQKSIDLLTDQDPYELAKTQLTIAEAVLSLQSKMLAVDQAKNWLYKSLNTFTTLGAQREKQHAESLVDTYVRI